MWGGSVGLGTRPPDVRARYYGSHVVTDNISVYSTDTLNVSAAHSPHIDTCSYAFRLSLWTTGI